MKIGRSFKIRQEDKLLLCCSRRYVNLEIREKILCLIQQDLNWDYLLEIASKHRLKPLLYYNLNLICSEKIPKNIMVELKDYFNKNSLKNLLFTRELVKILKLLKDNDINAFPYKGPVLADMAYGNMSFREFDDIDILINKSDAINSKNLMLSCGYQLYIPTKINDLLYLNMDSEYRFFNDNPAFKAEINWNFEGMFFSFSSNPKFLFEDLECHSFAGITIYTFSPENHILVLCIHASKHDWKCLSWISDISELINSYDNINWFEVLRKANNIGVKRILFINLVLAIDLFQLMLPIEVVNELKTDIIALKLSDIIKNRLLVKKKSINAFEKFIFDIKKRDKIKYGLKDSMDSLFKPSYADFQIFPLPRYLFILYYLIRPFLLLKRYK